VNLDLEDTISVLPADIEILYELFSNASRLESFLNNFPGRLRFPHVVPAPSAPAGRRRRAFVGDTRNFLQQVPVERISSKTEAEQLGSCPVCLCEYKARMSVRVLSCGHKVHKPCFDAWTKRGRFTCPLDNVKLSGSTDD
jgi:hypothetical protein